MPRAPALMKTGRSKYLGTCFRAHRVDCVDCEVENQIDVGVEVCTRDGWGCGAYVNDATKVGYRWNVKRLVCSLGVADADAILVEIR